MRFVVTILLLLESFVSHAEQWRTMDSVWRSVHKDRRAVFLVCRATKAKTNLITRAFNSFDSAITHVAIGMVRNGKVRVYSVEDRMSPGTALGVGAIHYFLQSADIVAFSLWRAAVSGRERRKIKKVVKGYCHRQIVFDYAFKIGNGDSLYCSEFCAMVLQETGIERFTFSSRRVEISGFYEAFLKRKGLIYYPVDFFRQNTVFARLFEIRL